MAKLIFCVIIVTWKVTNPFKIMKKSKNIKTLGEISTTLISVLSQQKHTVFSIKEAAVILGVNPTQIRKLLHDLVNKGWLTRIQKGLYLLIPLEARDKYTEHPFIVGSKLMEFYYIGFWTMLNYYGYTEQLPNTIFVASPKQKKNLNFMGVGYNFIRVASYKMFGLSEININENLIKVTDKEKTIVDCLDHPEYCGGIVEAAKGVWNSRNEIDAKKILDYCNWIRNSSVAKRFGYLSEIFNIDSQKELRLNLKKIIGEGYTVLDPLLPRKGNYLSNWNLILNVSKEDLISWRTT